MNRNFFRINLIRAGTAALLICAQILFAQPAVVPDQTYPTFQSSDLDPTDALAREQHNQAAWESAMADGTTELETAWEANARAIMDAALLANVDADFYNANPRYTDYLRSSVLIQIAEQKADWQFAAANETDIERQEFLASLTEKIRVSLEEDRKARLAVYDSGQETDPDRNHAQSEAAWRAQYYKDYQDGVYQFQTAQGALEDRMAAYDAERQATEDIFQQNFDRILDAEQNVRNGIASSLVTLGNYLTASDFFYEETCAGAVCTIDRGTMNAEGIALQNLIATVQNGLVNDAPLTALAQTMVDYFELQEQRATDRRDYWITQERGNINYDVLDSSSPNRVAAINDPGALWVAAVAYDPGQRDARNAANSANNWAQIESWMNGGSSMGTLAKGILRYYENSDSSILYDYLINYTGSNTDTREIETLISADIRDESGAYFPNGNLEWNPGTGGPSDYRIPWAGFEDGSVNYLGGQWRHTRQYGYNTATFSNSGRAVFYSGTDVQIRWNRQTGVDADGDPVYGPTQTSSYTLFRQAADERYMVNANWIDNTAIANTARWNGYLNEVTGTLDHWRDNILPAITNWEAQVATYSQTYTDWQATSATQRQAAYDQYQTASGDLSSARNAWLSRVNEEYRLGNQAWLERKADAPGTTATAKILKDESDNINAILDRSRFPDVDRAAERELADSNLPDARLLDGVGAAFATGLTGALQLSLVAAANDRGVARRDAIIEQLAKQAIDAGYEVEVSANGTITGKRDIASGKAIQIAGSRGTSEYDYQMELKSQSLQVTGADAFKLAETGVLFGEKWDLAKVEAEARANLAEYNNRLATKVKAEQQNYKDKDNEKDHYFEEFEKDRAGKIEAAKAAEEKKKGWLSGFTDALFTSMLGGMNFAQATQSYVQNQTTSLWTEATGLPRGLVAGLSGGSSFHDAMKGYIKTETTGLIAEKAAKDSGVPAGVLAGILNGETVEDSIAAYAEEQAYVQLEEKTGIPGFGALLKGQKTKKEAEKEKQKQLQDTAITVAAVAAAPVSGGGSLVALAAYKASEGYKTGGTEGAVVAGAAGLVNAASYAYAGGAVNVELTYDKKNGLQGSVGAGYGGANVGITYTKEGGYGANVGLTMADVGNVGLSYNKTEGVGANVGIDPKVAGGVGMTLRHTEYGGTSGSIDFSKEKNGNKVGGALSFNQTEGWSVSANAGKKGAGTGTLSYSEKKGLGAALQTDVLGKAEKFAGVSGGIAYNAKDGASANLALGTTNAFNWSETAGYTGNANFLAQSFESERLAKAKQAQDDAKKKLAAKEAEVIAKANEIGVGGGEIKSMEELHAHLENNPGDKAELQAQGIEFAEGTSVEPGFFSEAWDTVKNTVGRALGITNSSQFIAGENGKFSVRTCFTNKVQTWAEHGPKHVNKINKGDRVWSYNERTRRLELNPVIAAFVRETKLIYIIKYRSGTVLESTGDHPFFIEGRGQVEARQLKPGDVSVSESALKQEGLVHMAAYRQNTMEIESIVIEERTETVYNFQVENAHTYFVGEPGQWALVHNSTPYDITPELVDALPSTTPQSIYDSVVSGIEAIGSGLAYLTGFSEGGLWEKTGNWLENGHWSPNGPELLATIEAEKRAEEIALHDERAETACIKSSSPTCETKLANIRKELDAGTAEEFESTYKNGLTNWERRFVQLIPSFGFGFDEFVEGLMGDPMESKALMLKGKGCPASGCTKTIVLNHGIATGYGPEGTGQMDWENMAGHYYGEWDFDQLRAQGYDILMVNSNGNSSNPESTMMVTEQMAAYLDANKNAKELNIVTHSRGAHDQIGLQTAAYFQGDGLKRLRDAGYSPKEIDDLRDQTALIRSKTKGLQLTSAALSGPDGNDPPLAEGAYHFPKNLIAFIISGQTPAVKDLAGPGQAKLVEIYQKGEKITVPVGMHAGGNPDKGKLKGETGPAASVTWEGFENSGETIVKTGREGVQHSPVYKLETKTPNDGAVTVAGQRNKFLIKTLTNNAVSVSPIIYDYNHADTADRPDIVQAALYKMGIGYDTSKIPKGKTTDPLPEKGK